MSKELVKSTFSFGGMTLLSRIFGFIRDMLIAYLFGSSAALDAFVLAFRIPNLMRRIFGEGAFSQAFVPILSEYKTNKTETEVKDFLNKITGNLAQALLILTILGMVFAPIIVRVFAPGFSDDKATLAVSTTMLRITFPYIFFISLTALSAGILNTYGKFAVSGFTPVLLNLSMILASLFLSPVLGIPEISLAWGVMVAGVVQLIFQWPFLKKINLLPKLIIDWQDDGVKKVLLLMIPAIFGAAVGQINLLVDTVFASYLVSGSISWLYYADRLLDLPLGIFGVTFATVMLPNLSSSMAAKNQIKFNKIVDWGIKSAILVAVPAAIGLYMLSSPMISTLFQSGKFTKVDVLMSSQSLMAYAPGVIGIILAKIFASCFYARKDIKTPVKISVIAVITNIVFNAILMQKFAHAGLSMATSIASLTNAGLLFICLKYKKYYISYVNWKKFILKVLIANIAMLLVLFYLTPNLDLWFIKNKIWKVVWLFSLITAGGIIYMSILRVAGFKPKDLLIREVS